MATGLLFMTQKETKNTTEDFNKLSIQVGLNGLSFCVQDTVNQEVLAYERVPFKVHSTPYLLLKELKIILNTKKIESARFAEVLVVHRNGLFSLVPKSLFQTEELPNYLKFNAKIMANDQIAYDVLDDHEMVNVYIPFTNVNNYIFELFGEFEFKHSGTVLIHTLLEHNRASQDTFCYVQIMEKEMELVVISQKKLLLYNYFEFKNDEDTLYYILFVLEQLNIPAESVLLRLFGNVEEGDALFKRCQEYVQNVSIFVPPNSADFAEDFSTQSIDLTVFNNQ
ncbi:MAG: DUF3822 family protein [Bacteroidota bacterium]